MSRIKFVVLLALVLSAFVLTGCGGDHGEVVATGNAITQAKEDLQQDGCGPRFVGILKSGTDMLDYLALSSVLSQCNNGTHEEWVRRWEKAVEQAGLAEGTTLDQYLASKSAE